jgi:hypothetical protein
MKKLSIFFLLGCFALVARSQLNQINIVNFTVKNQLPATIDGWNNVPAALLMTAQKVPGSRVLEPRLVVQIRNNGAIICGNTPATARPIDVFDVRTFNTSDITAALGNCHELKEGSYTICVQFYNVDKVAISHEVCKDFRVEASNIEYAPPALITPENEKKFSLQQLQGPVVFRWTTLVPKPKETVTYRLKVWQLMQGQTATQAMRANSPLITKDVDNLTQTTVNGILTGPCKPPYLCEFIWNVQALNRNGKPVGNNNGNSEPFSFKMSNDIDIQIDSVHVSCCANGVQNFLIIIKNNLTNTVKITQLKIDKVNGATANPAISGLSPALPINIPGSGSQTFTGSIKCIDTAKTIRFFVAAEDAVDNAITETEVETDTLQCACDPCRVLGVTVAEDKLTTSANGSNEITLSGLLNGVDPNKIKKLTIELVYFNIDQTGDSNCAKCAQNREWGNFVPPATSSFTGFGSPVLNGGSFGREWTWISSVQKNCGDVNGGGDGTGVGHDQGKMCSTCPGGVSTTPVDPNLAKTAVIIQPPPPPPGVKQNSFSLPIAVPPGSTLSCCGDKIKVCIRFTWWDFCCHACDVIKCYEIERKPTTSTK